MWRGTVFLYPTPNADTSKAGRTFWQVKDLEAEVRDIKGSGVKFEKYKMPDVTMQDRMVQGR